MRSASLQLRLEGGDASRENVPQANDHERPSLLSQSLRRWSQTERHLRQSHLVGSRGASLDLPNQWEPRRHFLLEACARDPGERAPPLKGEH